MCVLSKPSIFFPMPEHGESASLSMLWENSSFQLSTIVTKEFSGEQLQDHILSSPRRQVVRSWRSTYMHALGLLSSLLTPTPLRVAFRNKKNCTASIRCSIANWRSARRPLQVFCWTSFPWKRSGSRGEPKSKWIRKEADHVVSISTCIWKALFIFRLVGLLGYCLFVWTRGCPVRTMVRPWSGVMLGSLFSD